MTKIKQTKPLHPRNYHCERYDFKKLITSLPELESYVALNKYNDLSIDFSNPKAVLTLNKALLANFYNIKNWEIPKDYLCPPIPGRADYVHYLADLLALSNEGKIPKGKNIHGLDVGIGASCIYPIIGSSVYGWHFVGSDIDEVSIDSANAIIKSNESLLDNVECRLQSKSSDILKGIINKDEKFDFVLCNPPFHKSLSDATKGSEQKWQNLNKNKTTENKAVNLNFGGQKAELWCDGGELKFIRKMIIESKQYQQQVLWFSCLVSKSDNIKPLKLVLSKSKAKQIKVIKTAQGNKISRFIVWSFLSTQQQQDWCVDHF